MLQISDMWHQVIVACDSSTVNGTYAIIKTYFSYIVLSINVFQKSLETHDCVLPWKWRSRTHQKGTKIGTKKEVNMYLAFE